MKRCGSCGETKPINEFGKQRGTKDGLRYCCKLCHNAARKAYVAEHGQTVSLQQRAYRDSHAEILRASKKAYNDAHAADTVARTKRWRLANPEKRRALARAEYRRNPARFYRATFNRQARLRGQFVEAIDPIVVAERDGWRCGICKRHVEPPEMSIDHILPLSRGGLHCYANVQLTHLTCNKRKNAVGQAQLRLIG